MRGLETGHGRLVLPAFLPDGTRAVVRSLDAEDVAASGIEAIMVNMLHLSTRPGDVTGGASRGCSSLHGMAGRRCVGLGRISSALAYRGAVRAWEAFRRRAFPTAWTRAIPRRCSRPRNASSGSFSLARTSCSVLTAALRSKLMRSASARAWRLPSAGGNAARRNSPS